MTTAIAIGREVVFYNKGKKWADSRSWIYIFSAMFLASSLLTMKNIYGLIPAAASTFSTVAFYSYDVKRMKQLLLIQSSGMLIYNSVYHSPAGICDAAFAILAIFISFIRIDREGIRSRIRIYRTKISGIGRSADAGCPVRRYSW